MTQPKTGVASCSFSRDNQQASNDTDSSQTQVAKKQKTSHEFEDKKPAARN